MSMSSSSSKVFRRLMVGNRSMNKSKDRVFKRLKSRSMSMSS